jgi:hypothetical protein
MAYEFCLVYTQHGVRGTRQRTRGNIFEAALSIVYGAQQHRRVRTTQYTGGRTFQTGGLTRFYCNIRGASARKISEHQDTVAAVGLRNEFSHPRRAILGTLVWLNI